MRGCREISTKLNASNELAQVCASIWDVSPRSEMNVLMCKAVSVSTSNSCAYLCFVTSQKCQTFADQL